MAIFFAFKLSASSFEPFYYCFPFSTSGTDFIVLLPDMVKNNTSRNNSRTPNPILAPYGMTGS
jgi:hypothetical protein